MAVRRRCNPGVVAGLLAGTALALGGLLAGVQPAGGTPILPTIYVNYTMNCTFAVTDDERKPVTTIAPGTYQVNVMTPESFGSIDLSGSESSDMTACKGFVQFQLTGPGVDLATTLDDGDSSFDQFSTVVFRKSSAYVLQDNNQPTVARATITTSATGVPIAPPTTYATTTTAKTTTKTMPKAKKKAKKLVVPFRGTLAASVSPAGQVALKHNGRPITSVTSGRYRIVVNDRSRKRGFAIQQSRRAGSTMTTNAYVGTRSLVLDLKPGQWFFYPTGGATAKKRYFIAVAP